MVVEMSETDEGLCEKEHLMAIRFVPRPMMCLSCTPCMADRYKISIRMLFMQVEDTEMIVLPWSRFSPCSE